MTTRRKPTPQQLRDWWSQSEQHLESCDEEECSWYWAFSAFLQLIEREPQTVADRYQEDPKRVAVGDVLADGFGHRLRVVAINHRAKQVTLEIINSPIKSTRTHTLGIIGSWLVVESPRDAEGG